MTNPIFRKISSGCAAFFCFLQFSMAQPTGTDPGSGMKYFSEGINAKTIDVLVDGKPLQSNRVVKGKYVDIALLQVTGFKPVNNKYFLGADILYVAPDKKVLKNIKNIFSDFADKGFSKKDLEDVMISLHVGSEIIQQHKEVDVMVRLYDLKSKNAMRFTLDLQIITPGAAPAAPSPSAAAGNRLEPANEKPKSLKGVRIKTMEVSVDKSIQVAPNMMYLSIEMLGISGSNLTEMAKGETHFSVKDEQGNPVPVSDKLLHKIKGSMEGSLVDFTVKIPFKNKTVSGKKYTVHFQWLSPDKSKSIEVIATR